MGVNSKSKIPEVLKSQEAELVREWIEEQLNQDWRQPVRADELREHCREFVNLLQVAIQSGPANQLDAPEWAEIRRMLADVSRTRSAQGFSPTETAMFIYSFKPPLFARLRAAHGADTQGLAEDLVLASQVIDHLGLWTAESYQKAREEIIRRQQQDMLELSTPVVKLWDGILALPIIGTLDSERSQVVMESLLHRIVETGSTIAIIDITGVPTVDTLTAQHLLKTVTAARLMGADCIISGVRPQIAQTIVHLGVNLADVTTKASLASAFALALERRHLTIVRAGTAKGGANG